jgi:hypothetical protein
MRIRHARSLGAILFMLACCAGVLALGALLAWV